MVYLVLIKANIDLEEVEESLAEIKRVEEEKDMLDSQASPAIQRVKEEFDKKTASKWLHTQHGNELDILKNISETLKVNLTEASDYITKYPIEPIVSGKTIPELVKELRDMRRELKGEARNKILKGIDHLINAYEHHIQKCMDSIYWLKPYQTPLKSMTLNPSKLHKLYNVKDGETRGKLIDLLCKMWESDLEKKSLDYGSEYSLNKNIITESKKEFRKILKEIPHQSVRKSKKEIIEDNVRKLICNFPGLTANQIHSKLPEGYSKISTPQSISKMCRKINATKVDSEYYLVKDIIKKDLYSYVAGFIDSDGYITMDKSYAPRIGMIATGNRGKAFFQELEKELKCGRLHLDQKVGENNRSQHRLNFYSQGDITTILNKCLPHLRMKQAQGKLLIEAIRIKKQHKREEWAKPRLEEIFKLMKYENWKDARNPTEFEKYGIDPEVVVKYHDNCKMGLMDELESGVN